MNGLVVVDKGADWRRLKALMLDSATRRLQRVYNLGLNEILRWYGQEPRPGFATATVAAWRVGLEARPSQPFPSRADHGRAEASGRSCR